MYPTSNIPGDPAACPQETPCTPLVRQKQLIGAVAISRMRPQQLSGKSHVRGVHSGLLTIHSKDISRQCSPMAPVERLSWRCQR